MRWRPWPVIRGPRCWPAARAWSRCCRCGWPRRRCSWTSTGCPAWTRSRADDVRRHGRGAGPARGRARLGRRTPGAAAGHDGAVARRARHHPQPRHHGRLARARRRGRGDAGRARPARWLARGRGAGRAAHHPRRRAATSARSSRACTTTRSRSRRSSRPSPRARAWPSTRSPAGTATTRWSAPPRWSTATRVKVGYLSVADVPTVVDLSGVPDDRLGEVALEQLEPGDDIHATADYRAQLVRVLTARVVRSAREATESAHERGAARRRADRQRHRAPRAGAGAGGCSPTRCATTSASPAPTSAASTASAAPARCWSTAGRCARA